MIVAAILRQKGSAAVETIAPSKCLADAAAILSAYRIGALICSSDGKTVEGMISERDIIRVLGKEGPGCLNQSIANVMTKDVKTCTIDETSEDLLKRMTAGRFRHLPVVTDGVLVGLISIGDAVKARIDDLEHEANALADMIKGY
ncbi:MAG: CBS domain-containing protein [Paracoccaceae bacterium]|jgi:CBS domain-containing protein